MKTFKQFITEGKKKQKKKEQKILKRLQKQTKKIIDKQIEDQRSSGLPSETKPISITYPSSEPHSPERMAHILDMERRKKEWLKSLTSQQH